MPYINTVDINGTTYYFENLTDGNYVVDLPELKENGTFLLQGDVEDKLNSYQSNKPLSANQGRVLNEQDKQLCSRIDDLTASIDSKDTELDGKIADLSKSSSQKDTELDEKISTLRTDMGNNDASTLTSAKAYADEQSSAAISSANEYANTGLDKKLDKSGGKITGALEVVGALTADQKLQTKYGMTIYQRGDVSKEITAVCTGENAGKFIGKSETDLARISVATPVNNDDAATKKYVDERVGSGGGAGIDYFDVYAEVEYSYVKIMDGFYVSNCLVTATFAEIKEALDAGKTPRIIETNSLDSRSLVGGIMSLYSYDSNSFVFTGVSRSANSASGLAVITIQADGTVMYCVAAGELPAVKDTDNGKYMLVDGGAWKAKVPPTATPTANGLMSAKDKTKLDNVAEGANKTTVIDALDPKSHNPVSSAALFEALSSKADRTEATEHTAGLMSPNDKRKLNGIEAGANKTVVDAALDGTSENPVQNKAVKTELDKKLNQSGGTVTGSLTLKGAVFSDSGLSFGTGENIHFTKAADDAAKLAHGAADVDDNVPLARLKVAAPTEGDDAATKQYVDALAAENVQDFLNAPVLTSPVMIRPSGATDLFGVYLSTVDIGEKYAEIRLEDVNENSPVAIANLRTPTGTGADSYAATKGYVDEKVSDATILTSPNGTKYKITVSDDGELSAVAVN